MSPEQLIPLAIIPVVLILVLVRNRRKRTLRPQFMWVMPVLIVPMISMGLWGEHMRPGAAPFSLMAALPAFVLALVLGAVVGWWRGKTITIEKEADGTLKAQASPLGLILIVSLLAVRGVLREVMQTNAAAWHLNASIVTDAFLVFAMGLVIAQRVEMYIRARRVLAGGGDSHVEVAA